MRKYSLLLAVMLAASFSTVADAAKKKAAAPVAKDAAYEWNIKNLPPPPQAATGAAQPAKAAKKVKKAKKGSAKKAKKA